MKRYLEYITEVKKSEEYVFDSEEIRNKYNDDDAGMMEWIYEEVSKIKEGIDFDIKFIINDIRFFDKYQGAYAIVTITDKKYDIWGAEFPYLWIKDYKVDNTSSAGLNPGYQGDIYDIINIINETEKIHTYKGQKDIIENHMDDFYKIKDIALPRIKKENPKLFQAVDWGLIN